MLTAKKVRDLAERWATKMFTTYKPLVFDDVINWTREDIESNLKIFLMENEDETSPAIQYLEIEDEPELEAANLEGWQIAIDKYITFLGA